MPKTNNSPNVRTEFFNNTNNAAQPNSNRQRLAKNRAAAQQFTANERFRKCGNTPIGTISMGLNGSKANYRGLLTCGWVWGCSCCNAKIMNKRKGEILEAVEANLSRNGIHYSETFTIPHTAEDSLVGLMAIQQEAFGIFNKSKKVANARKAVGYLGYNKTLEQVYDRDSGWHPHIVILHFFEKDFEEHQYKIWKAVMLSEWNSAVLSAGGGEASEQGYHFMKVPDPQTYAGYLTKQSDRGIALPLEGPIGESAAHKKARTPWDILNDAIANKKPEDLRLWADYVQATKRRRFITWSKDLRKKLKISEPLEESDIAAEVSTNYEAVLTIDNQSYFEKLRLYPLRQAKYLDLLETIRFDYFCERLTKDGIGFTLTTYGEELYSGASKVRPNQRRKATRLHN